MFSLIQFGDLTSLNLVFLLIQIIYGIFWLYSGLNGFFRWKAPPSVSPEIDSLSVAFIKSGFLMTTIKIIEVIVGLLFILDTKSFLASLLITPVLYGICGLHLKYNSKPWILVCSLSLPFLIIIIKDLELWKALI